MSERKQPDPEGIPAPIPIDGTLDLHAFRPQDVKPLVQDYLQACRERGILLVRIIHGKGIGVLRRTVHSLLAKRPDVIEYHLDFDAFGGRGATIVRLRPMDPPPRPEKEA